MKMMYRRSRVMPESGTAFTKRMPPMRTEKKSYGTHPQGGPIPMNNWHRRRCLILALAIFFIAIPCCAADTNESDDSAGKVTVTDVSIDPEVLMTGDVGLVTFTVENTGEQNVAISNAELISKDITVLNGDIYKSTRVIGAGTKMKFSFTILADQPENIYYPAFYLNYKSAGSLRYNVPIRVEHPDLSLAVSGLPETFSKGVKNTIILNLGNAKSVNMTGISIIPSGEGIQCNQTSFFIGNLGPHTEKSVAFEIIPSVPTTLGFNVSYTCGMNAHQTSFTIPIPLGQDKRAADPIINNIATTSGVSGVTLSGDVSNAGLSDAFGVIVSSLDESGSLVSPNSRYVIGTITAGDYASFEIMIPSSSEPVPVEIQYKDDSGNQYSRKTLIDTRETGGGMLGGTVSGSWGDGSSGGVPGQGSATGSSTTSGGGRGVSPMNPLSGMGKGADGLPLQEIFGGVVLLLIAGFLWMIWRRKIRGRKITFAWKK